MALAVVAALLAGCMAGTLQRKRMPLFHKGMSEADVLALVSQPPLCTLRFDAVGAPRMQVYRVTPASRTTHYLMLYEFQRLAYWGYFNEYQGTPRPELADFARAAARVIAAGRCDDQRVLDAG